MKCVVWTGCRPSGRTSTVTAGPPLWSSTQSDERTRPPSLALRRAASSLHILGVALLLLRCSLAYQGERPAPFCLSALFSGFRRIAAPVAPLRARGQGLRAAGMRALTTNHDSPTSHLQDATALSTLPNIIGRLSLSGGHFHRLSRLQQAI